MVEDTVIKAGSPVNVTTINFTLASTTISFTTGHHCHWVIMITMKVSLDPPIPLFYGAITQPEKLALSTNLIFQENLLPRPLEILNHQLSFVSYGCSKVKC